MPKHGTNIRKTAILRVFNKSDRKSPIINTERIFTMKKILAAILVFAAIITVFCSCSKESKPVTSGEYTYVVLEDNTAKITKYNGTQEIIELDIPAAIDDVTVTVIGAEAFAGVQTIKVVNIPETLLKIEENAFKGSSVKKAFMHRAPNLSEIGAFAFAECPNLVQADMPRNLAVIGEKAFQGCTNLKVANFRGNTETIDKFAFDACPNVKIYVKSELNKVISYADTYHLETVVSD